MGSSKAREAWKTLRNLRQNTHKRVKMDPIQKDECVKYSELLQEKKCLYVYGFLNELMDRQTQVAGTLLNTYYFIFVAAPFCYIYDDPVHLYFSFRAFYLRYWHRLHRVCGNSQGVVALCLLFEKLLQCFDPLLWNHFRKYHVPPLRLVIKWIMRAFSGHLPPEQLLTLWDLVLAYDSLEIISLLAVVILIFRRDNLLKVTTLQNIEAVLADLSSIAVIPLLQMALMKDL
uniref:TBC1 domain family member 19-like n=1 Tax=Diabrotica virgifera virgifera TaxID=50390 RepID=A0A6P7GQS5_DIAVI